MRKDHHFLFPFQAQRGDPILSCFISSLIRLNSSLPERRSILQIMTKYVMLQCPNSNCNFRFPSEIDNYSIYCPLCGEKLKINEYDLDNGYAHFTKNSAIHLECALDNVRSSYNVGSILRTASAFSLDHLYLCGFTPTPDLSKVKKTSLGAEIHIPWSHEPNALTLVRQKKVQFYRIYAIEASESADSLVKLDKTIMESPILFILGNEIFGVDPEIRALSDAVLQIPITGYKKSLNVSTAFAISLFYFSTALL
jgi:tRNA(Leu) C34 or U34 (ribose-2'-O)-methylase TrmL